jgi:uncharacterized protein YggE
VDRPNLDVSDEGARMNRSVTLSARGVLVALVAALALVVAYLLGNGGGTAQASAQTPAASTGHPRTLLMTGTGRTVGVPDELSFTVTVGLVRPDLATALADANATMNRVLAALASSGVQRSDVQTTGLSMYPVYDYHSSGPPTLRGYRVSQRAQVLVRDLSKGGGAVTAAVHAGGNDVRVGQLGLRIADPEALLAQSRAAAVKEATAKAQEYADATGQTLGSVLSLREVHASAPSIRMPSFHADSLSGLKGALPIRAGKDKLAVTVRIAWSLA